MGNGLLAQWRRSIVTRGTAGAILLAVPVGVAAAIGFGTSLSGVAGGLSAIAEGPDTITTSTAPTPAKLNRAVATLANRDGPGSANAAPGRAGLPGGAGVDGIGDGSAGVDGTSGGGTGTTDPTGTIDPPRIDLPGGGAGGGGGGGGDGGNTVNGVEDTVNGVVDGVGSTVNGILGG